jgi:hypothetical protein
MAEIGLCDNPCLGDVMQSCGGSAAVAIYGHKDPPEIPTSDAYQYLGWYDKPDMLPVGACSMAADRLLVCSI